MAAIFTTLASVCIILIYLAYLAVTGPMLYRRFQGWPRRSESDAPAVDADGKKLFSLGPFGIVVNLLAVIYGALMVVNLSWPRAEVFDPAGEMPVLRWAGPICIAATVIVGIACYPRGKEHPKPVKVGF